MLHRAVEKKLKKLSQIISFSMSRSFQRRVEVKKVQPMSRREQFSLSQKLIKLLKDNNKQDCDLMLDHQFYNKLENNKGLQNILDMKTSAAFYFRDYPMFLMDLDNQRMLLGQESGFQKIFVRKILAQLLSDHDSLAKSIKKFYKTSKNWSILSAYLVSLSQLVLGSFAAGQSNLIKILNTSFTQIDSRQIGGLNLLEKRLPNQLNLKQQIFFNLLIFAMYKKADDKYPKQSHPIDLYRKIKEGKKLNPEDFMLTDYEQFLNIWVSAKHDKPMEWVDIEDKTPYYRYLYMLAENSYISKNVEKVNSILSQLPQDYPLRHFLELSQLYDQKKYDKLKQKFTAIKQKAQQKSIKYYKEPQFDIVILNMFQLLKKVSQKQKKSQMNESQTQWNQSIILFRYNANIKNIQGKGIPFYYFDIPLKSLMMTPSLLTLD